MHENPPILSMRRNFARPTANQLARLAGVPTGHVVDAQGGSGALDKHIKPLDPPTGAICGVALTCHAGPRDNLALFATLDLAEPGDIVVAAADGFSDAAIVGDFLAGLLKNIGVAAVITDSAARDVQGIRQVGLPIYCSGISPNSPAKFGPGTVGLPVVLGGVAVSSGDIVVADEDGVVVVPQANLATMLQRLDGIRADEADQEARVRDGMTIPDWLRDLLASDRIREIP